MSVVVRAPCREDAELVASLLAAEGVSKVVLFGSVARGEATEHSDIDLVAIYDDIDYRHREAKKRELTARAECTVGYEVDVVVTDRPEWKARSENFLTSLEYSVARHGVVLVDKEAERVDWGKQMVLPTNGYEATVRCLREVVGALTTLHMHLNPGEMERESRGAHNYERAIFLTVLRFEGAGGQVQRIVESAIKALAHHSGRRRELRGHDVGDLCTKLVEPYRGEINALLDVVGAEVNTRWRQDARYTPQHVLDEPLTSERVAQLAEVACRVASYLVEQLDESVPYVTEVQDHVTLVEQWLERYDLETGTPRV